MIMTNSGGEYAILEPGWHDELFYLYEGGAFTVVTQVFDFAVDLTPNLIQLDSETIGSDLSFIVEWIYV